MSTLAQQVRNAKQRRRRKLIGYGLYVPPLVDPTPAREHIAALRALGLSRDSIALLAGVHEGMIEQITMPAHHQYRKTIRRETAERILAARFDLDALPPHVQVDVIGTQRRIRALSCMGWSQSYIAERLGVTVGAVGFYTKPDRRYITVRSALRVRDLYVELNARRGPSSRCASRALSRGWAPPMAWDDETIDDPATTPDLDCLVRPSVHDADAVVEDVRWILDHQPSLTLAQVASRLGMQRDAVAAAIGRSAKAAYAAALVGQPFGPLTELVAAAAESARRDVLAVREQMKANVEAAGRRSTRRRKDDAA